MLFVVRIGEVRVRLLSHSSPVLRLLHGPKGRPPLHRHLVRETVGDESPSSRVGTAPATPCFRVRRPRRRLAGLLVGQVGTEFQDRPCGSRRVRPHPGVVARVQEGLGCPVSTSTGGPCFPASTGVSPRRSRPLGLWATSLQDRSDLSTPDVRCPQPPAKKKGLPGASPSAGGKEGRQRRPRDLQRDALVPPVVDGGGTGLLLPVDEPGPVRSRRGRRRGS